MSTQIIRCPVCMASQPIKTDLAASQLLHCGNCKRNFPVKNGLPLNQGETVNFSGAAATPAKAAVAMDDVITIEKGVVRSVALTWALGIIIGLVTINKARHFVVDMRGSDFLFFYGFMFVAIWIVLALVRKFWEDSIHATIIALLIFEVIGIVRYMDASAAGMHKFMFMFFMMGVGALLLFARTDHNSNKSSAGSCSSGSSCSGCGGGGGCGGCG